MQVSEAISQSTPLAMSEKKLLALLFQRGFQTQAQLAEATDLTQQSASRLLAGLADKGMLVEGEKTASGKRGYPSITMGLRAEHAYSFGISIMADAVGLTLVDFSVDVVAIDSVAVQ